MAEEQRKRRPKAPGTLQPPGRALWRRLVNAYEFQPGELALLELVCAQLDDVAALERLIAAEGLTVEGSRGQARLNAAVTEVRQARLALGKLLGQLALPDEVERPMSAAATRAKRAADARWSRERARRERPTEGRFRGAS